MLLPTDGDLPGVLRGWSSDAQNFLRHDGPKIVLVLLICGLLIWILRSLAKKFTALQIRRLPSGFRVQQVRTLASVITSVGVFIILFVASLEVLPLLGLNLGPLLASAGVAGIAIGFGAQTLVKDFINGFFILIDNQYDLGDKISIAGVKGVVEDMSLRRTTLRDDDGTVHVVPNSQITIVSNMTRDWSQVAMRVVVSYSEPSDRIVRLLEQVGEDLRHDPGFEHLILSDVDVPGIDRVGGGEAEYLMLVKTKPNHQFAVSRELRRRIKEVFERNKIQTPAPGRVYVMDQGRA